MSNDSPSRSGASAILLYVPLTDPTAPYHSLTYVGTFAKVKGFSEIYIRDTNIEALEFTSAPAEVLALVEYCRQIIVAFSRRDFLNGYEQLQYQLALRGQYIEPESVRASFQALRDPLTYQRYPEYRKHVKNVLNWLEVLSIRGFPGQFTSGFNLAWDGIFNLSAVEDLTSEHALNQLAGPFGQYFHKVLLPELKTMRPKLIGINITYTSQLPYAVWLSSKIREALPGCAIVAGGTEVSDVYKYSDIRDFSRVFYQFDACIVGEGESAFVEILRGIEEDGVVPPNVPNAIFPRNPGPGRVEKITYESVEDLPTPDYSMVQNDQYLSPHRLVYYSPTRGCYWNKCTFCDYGLNFGTPTSPWRQRKIATIVRDLKVISQSAEYVYFSVDVLAPGALVRLAQAIVTAGLKIRWAAEIRLEKSFDKEACDILAASGCVAVSFGFETAAQRILDLINKGTRIADVASIMKHFSNAGIAVQMMGFTGFPTETSAEALTTIEYLEQTSSDWTVAAIGEFVLTPGSIVASRPRDFRIQIGKPTGAGFLNRTLPYDEVNQVSAFDRSRVDERKADIASAEFSRPFAGGIDTAHSMIFYARFGKSFPKKMLGRRKKARAKLELRGHLNAHVSFSSLDCMTSEELRELHKKAKFGRNFCSKDVMIWLGSKAKPVFRVKDRNPIFVRWDGFVLPCDQWLFEALSAIADPANDQAETGRDNLERSLAMEVARELDFVE
jgi:hypothetical protein